MADALTAVVRTLDRDCRGGVRLMQAHSDPWASATFIGGRHWMLLGLALNDAERLAPLIEEMEFTIAGHLVADMKLIAVTRCEQEATLTLEMLTVETA